ncbi:MAG: hypothetical protein OEM50_00145 [Gammaproteobacteria bacterium]|nr:hypothetical protein [Gammaproteobacteria bacterium]MDH3363287.1 hypothetical protein [Gammaproteobacteria bacterium]MDH3480092.1 hypothetical protein [Gammaproteobacteria bacterium]
MSNIITIREQLRRNAVALISLVVAITSLGYNTWRNEASEHNRNQRLLSIEVLPNAGELQQEWDKNWQGLGPKRDSYERIIDAIAAVRKDTHALLQSLD